jgi:hypothetical protein
LACRNKYFGEVGTRVGAEEQRLGRLREHNCFFGESFGVVVVTAPCCDLREHLPCEHLCRDVITCAELEAELGPVGGFFGSSERVERVGELAGLGREPGALAHLLVR